MNKTFICSTRSIHSALMLLAGLTFPAIAFAHPGHVSGSVFAQGFVHPFTGLDHLLAMLASGMWAAQLGGRARWQVPAVFVGMMMLGAFVGMHTGAVALVETGVVASVVVLGLLVAAAARAPHLIGALVVATFAALHGLAHGSEMASSASIAFYVVGIALATLLLHGVAVGLVTLLLAYHRMALVRAAGVLIAAAGTLLLAS